MNTKAIDIYFATLHETLEGVRAYLAASDAVLQDGDALGEAFSDGVQYKQTVTRVLPLAVHGKLVCYPVGRARRALCVSIFRMDSGTYELTRYIN